MKYRKRLCLVITALLLFAVNVDAFASEIKTCNEMCSVGITENESDIQKLLDERALLLSEIGFSQNADEKEQLTIELHQIDSRLISLGAVFLSPQEVAMQFPETKNDKSLALAGKTQSKGLYAVVPSSSVNDWISYRTTYTSGGISYEIQRLVAQPISASSPLINNASRIVEYRKSFTAGAVNVLQTLAESSVGAIPGASKYVTFYNAAKAFVEGMSTTTEIQSPEVTYTWAGTTTAVFTYVKKSGQSDDYQWLSLISTKNTMVVGYNMSDFSYKLSNGSWVLVPDVIQGKQTINSVPTGYDNNSVAINAYNSTAGGPVHRAVDYVQISGAESTSVQKVYICYPNFPAQCE